VCVKETLARGFMGSGAKQDDPCRSNHGVTVGRYKRDSS
jgi:hypothetical protein